GSSPHPPRRAEIPGKRSRDVSISARLVRRVSEGWSRWARCSGNPAQQKRRVSGKGALAMQFAMTSKVGTSNNEMKKTRILLWTVQGLLAATFLMAGSMKLMLPIEELTQELDFPGWFLRFIGVCEVLGGLGLVLPGLARIRTGLTPLAAAGLVIIMV